MVEHISKYASTGPTIERARFELKPRALYPWTVLSDALVYISPPCIQSTQSTTNRFGIFIYANTHTYDISFVIAFFRFFSVRYSMEISISNKRHNKWKEMRRSWRRRRRKSEERERERKRAKMKRPHRNLHSPHTVRSLTYAQIINKCDKTNANAFYCCCFSLFLPLFVVVALSLSRWLLLSIGRADTLCITAYIYVMNGQKEELSLAITPSSNGRCTHNANFGSCFIYH